MVCLCQCLVLLIGTASCYCFKLAEYKRLQKRLRDRHSNSQTLLQDIRIQKRKRYSVYMLFCVTSSSFLISIIYVLLVKGRTFTNSRWLLGIFMVLLLGVLLAGLYFLQAGYLLTLPDLKRFRKLLDKSYILARYPNFIVYVYGSLSAVVLFTLSLCLLYPFSSIQQQKVAIIIIQVLFSLTPVPFLIVNEVVTSAVEQMVKNLFTNRELLRTSSTNNEETQLKVSIKYSGCVDCRI